MIVADTPGLSSAELIAAAMPLRLSFDDVMFTFIDLPPTDTFNVPVPSAAAEVVLNALEVRLCALATCDTLSEYVPDTAPLPALAVTPEPLAVAENDVSIEPLNSGARLTCNADSEADSWPRAEIWVLSAVVWAVSAEVWPATFAVTRADTSDETSSELPVEPPIIDCAASWSAACAAADAAAADDWLPAEALEVPVIVDIKGSLRALDRVTEVVSEVLRLDVLSGGRASRGNTYAGEPSSTDGPPA